MGVIFIDVAMEVVDVFGSLARDLVLIDLQAQRLLLLPLYAYDLLAAQIVHLALVHKLGLLHHPNKYETY